ncbi:hypothetical protein AURDEDRAFT_122801 [Auricularia subglabra TFB-10046 SS5]|nr:hypothetical protein AURDEDRAFT_122801 [Auricularia subglabra TFB-10046 SS5]
MSSQLTRRNAVPDLRAHYRALETTISDGAGTQLRADDPVMHNDMRGFRNPFAQYGVDGYASDATVATCGSEEHRDVMFVDLDSRAVSPVYPLTGCDEDVVFHKNRNDDDDTPPPPYMSVSTRYSLAGAEIIQDDLRPVQLNAESTKRDIYRPPALRTGAKPDTSFKEGPTIRSSHRPGEALNALDFAARNPQRTMNVLTKLSTEDRLTLACILAALCPRNEVTFRIDPIAAVIAAWPKYMGITYDVRFANGHTARLRDVDVWRSPNGRIMTALFWGDKTRVMSIEDIEKLLLLPQYRAEGGFFLQAMKAELLKGTVRAPRIGRAIF